MSRRGLTDYLSDFADWTNQQAGRAYDTVAGYFKPPESVAYPSRDAVSELFEKDKKKRLVDRRQVELDMMMKD